MENDHRGPGRPKTVIKVASASIAASIAFTCLCLLPAWAAYWAYVVKPQDFKLQSETTVKIDTSGLPENATEEDWYPLALQVLEESGWELPPNLVMLGSSIPCSPPATLKKLDLEFIATDLVGIIPHPKAASLDLDRLAGTASIEFYDAGPGFTRSRVLEFSEMRVRLHDALDIADANGGQQFRKQVASSCRAYIYVRDYTWKIFYYSEPSQPNHPSWSVDIDARTGKATRLTLP